MVNCIQSGDVYQISFKYDPTLIELVKNVPGRRWNPNGKFWTIPKTHLGWFLNEVKGTQYEHILNIVSDEYLNVNESIDTTVEIPKVDLKGVTYHVKEGSKPFAHQLDFMRYAIDRYYNKKQISGFILTDEQGLAKTSEVMNWALYQRNRQKYKHCLVIVCINGAKYNWAEDIELHTNGKEVPYILGTRLRRDGITKNYDAGSAAKLEDLQLGHMYGKKTHPKLPYFLVTNIESIRMKKGRKSLMVDEIIKQVKSGNIGIIAIDEIHINMSPSSLQGKAILDIKKATKKLVEWVPLTGTPIINRPTDVFTPLKLVDGHAFSTYWSWEQNFCVFSGFGNHDILGYKNIPQLKQMLQGNMLRRLKKDVYDLPPKIVYTEYVDSTAVQKKLYTQIQLDLQSRREEIIQQLNPLSALMKLRQVSGSPELIDPTIRIDDTYLSKNSKFKRIMELLADIHDRGEKVIIYSNWVEPLKTLYAFVSKKYKTCCYNGTMSQADRIESKKAFIDNPQYTVMLGTIGALGTSHTLTVARNVIFLDEPWQPAAKVQAEDRIHRPGTTHSVNIYSIIVKDTVDDVVHNILKDKKLMADYIVDDKLDLRHNPELFDKLTIG